MRHTLPSDIGDAVAVARKSMEACIEGAARSTSPEPFDEPPSSPHLPFPSIHLDTDTDPPHHLLLPAHTAARVEDALVSTPQKLALAALQTFQHSVRVLQLHETSISQAMAEIPALRHYYNSRQPTATVEKVDAETAVADLHAAIRQTANPEYEKVAKLVVANLEFETQLRGLLEGFQGLKERWRGLSRGVGEEPDTFVDGGRGEVAWRGDERVRRVYDKCIIDCAGRALTLSTRAVSETSGVSCVSNQPWRGQAGESGSGRS